MNIFFITHIISRYDTNYQNINKFVTESVLNYLESWYNGKYCNWLILNDTSGYANDIWNIRSFYGAIFI